jgi:hypothetical protein
MGWGVQILLFSKIGNLRNFSLYIAKIVFFGHTVSRNRTKLKGTGAVPEISKLIFLVDVRVARFFLVHDTKTGKIVPNEQKIFIVHKISQMSVKYSKWP